MSRNTYNTNAGQLPSRKIWYVVALLICIVIFILVAYSLIRYFIDLNNYKKAHQAYLQSNCALAIPYYSKILNGNRLIDLGGFFVLAQQEGRECQQYQNAVQRQESQEYDEALLEYMVFIHDFRASTLTGFARNRATSLFGVTTPAELASQDTCSQTPFLIDENLIPQPELNLSLFYMACGNFYDAANMHQEAYDMYETFLTEYPDNPFAQTVESQLISNPIACENIPSLKENKVISNRVDFLPGLYRSCAQMYTTDNKSQAAFDLYATLMTEYPQHPVTAEVETYVLSSSIACENMISLQNNDVISVREDFLPRLYYNCGQAYEDSESWVDAIGLYETFLAEYPNHPLGEDVEAGLARSIVEQSAPFSAGEISPPTWIGNTLPNIVEVVIYNNSPEQIRIIFSGPEAQIATLESCSSCTEYPSGTEPSSCLNSPRGTYTLEPGEYNVVVEVISDTGVIPWTGKWPLEGGNSYGRCFYIETITAP